MLTSNNNANIQQKHLFFLQQDILYQTLIQNKQNTCKRRSYYNTVNYLLYREQNKKNNETKNKQVQH